MTVVYLDSFVLVNFVLNYLLLLASGKIAGERIRLWKISIASLLGAGYAACTFFPSTQFAMHPTFKIGVAVIMILIVFGKTSNLLRISIVFVAISCAFCGGILAIEFFKGGSYTQDGILYSSLDMKALLMSAVFCYGILTLFFKRAGIHNMKKNELVDISVQLNENKVDLIALHDTGNTLQDPLTGQQILVVEGERVLSLFPHNLQLNQEALSNPIESMEYLSEKAEMIKFRLLPYRAVGVDCGMLLSVRVDCITVQGEDYKNHFIALSPTPVSDGGAYSVLMGCDYIKQGIKKG